jgi:hypothetical protein
VNTQLTNPAPYDVMYGALKDMADHAQRGQAVPGVPEGCSSEISPFVDPVVEKLAALKTRGTPLVGDQLKFVLALQAGFQ